MRNPSPPLDQSASKGLDSPSPHGDTAIPAEYDRQKSEPLSEKSDAADLAHEHAIQAAGLDVQEHMRLRDNAMRRYVETSCFTDRAEADRQLMLAREAAEYQRVLCLNRSPAQRARMQAEQAVRMAQEPGATRPEERWWDLERAISYRGRG